MRSYLIDLVERVAATGAFAFLSVFSVSDLSTLHDAEIAAFAAMLSLAKGALAGFLNGSAGVTSSK